MCLPMMSALAVNFQLKDMVTVSIAAVGAVLGVINTLHSLDQKRVKLRVVPKFAHFVIDGHLGDEVGCIEVVNLSAFPVTLSEMGFTVGHNTARKGDRAVITGPLTADRKSWARRLDSREALTGYFDLSSLPYDIGKAYVKTDCDEVGYGVSATFQNYYRRRRR